MVLGSIAEGELSSAMGSHVAHEVPSTCEVRNKQACEGLGWASTETHALGPKRTMAPCPNLCGRMGKTRWRQVCYLKGSSVMRRQAMLVGVAGVLAVDYLLRNLLVPAVPTETMIRVAIGIEWALLAGLLVFWIPRVERDTWLSVGIGRWSPRYLFIGVGWFVVTTVVSALAGMLLGITGLESLADLQPRLAEYAWPTLLALALIGPAFEEVFYRGYLIERVAILTGRVWVAAGVSWVTFTGVHLGFFGLGATLNATVFSAALVWLYVRERSIWPVFVLHALNSVFAYLLVPLLA